MTHRGRALYMGGTWQFFRVRRLRLQSAEKEPLPTIVASDSPACYKRSFRRKKVVDTVETVHAVFWAGCSVVLAAFGRVGSGDRRLRTTVPPFAL